jgi:hypothetical protein
MEIYDIKLSKEWFPHNHYPLESADVILDTDKFVSLDGLTVISAGYVFAGFSCGYWTEMVLSEPGSKIERWPFRSYHNNDILPVINARRLTGNRFMAMPLPLP